VIRGHANETAMLFLEAEKERQGFHVQSFAEEDARQTD
jgi:hypothetical protein